MEKQLYGEILFLGECNYNCYYCLKHEMKKLQIKKESHLKVHFSKWKNFEKYIQELHKKNIKKIYLSSTCTDPLLYKYLEELVIFLQKESFKVGLRSNGCLSIEKFDVIRKFDAGISFSINSFDKNVNEAITGNQFIPDFEKLFKKMESENINIRVSIVVNRYNYKEIPNIILILLKHSKIIKYIQLRKMYKYYGQLENEEKYSYEYIKQWVQKNGIFKKKYYDSGVYDYNGMEISLWENVFNIENIQSINYFTNGLISDYNLLIPIYEEDMNEYK
ncbi:MAG: radical SAM protein [Bacilli bacterium]|nr:radical SAM protein [Bacilli bacterium]